MAWALRDHARNPNATNLDTHYLVPSEGVWALAHSSDPVIQPRAAPSPSPSPYPGTTAPPERQGPRERVDNTPASPVTFASLAAAPKPPAPPAPGLPSSPASALLPKLRWANVGWFYHWGTKQYDFAREQVPVDDALRRLCTAAVRGVPWAKVFADGVEGAPGVKEWEGESWEMWHEEYGRSCIYSLTTDPNCDEQTLMPESSTSTRQRYAVPKFSEYANLQTTLMTVLLAGHAHGTRRPF